MKFTDNMPSIYDAVEITAKHANDKTIVVEVLQQLEDGYIRGVAMDSTDGFKRGDIAKGTG